MHDNIKAGADIHAGDGEYGIGTREEYEKFVRIRNQSLTKRLFLDTEFNGFNGQLLSMALVPEKQTDFEFYRELQFSGQLDPWVRENVIPHMIMAPCTRHEFQQALAQYLWEIGECTIIADWPDDIRHFCESLITGPGMCLTMLHNIKFELDWGIEYESAVPHNALHDARAIRDFYMNREYKLKENVR